MVLSSGFVFSFVFKMITGGLSLSHSQNGWARFCLEYKAPTQFLGGIIQLHTILLSLRFRFPIIFAEWAEQTWKHQKWRSKSKAHKKKGRLEREWILWHQNFKEKIKSPTVYKEYFLFLCVSEWRKLTFTRPTAQTIISNTGASRRWTIMCYPEGK